MADKKGKQQPTRKKFDIKSVHIQMFVVDRPEAQEMEGNKPLKNPDSYEQWADRTRTDLDPDQPAPKPPSKKSSGSGKKKKA